MVGYTFPLISKYVEGDFVAHKWSRGGVVTCSK